MPELPEVETVRRWLSREVPPLGSVQGVRTGLRLREPFPRGVEKKLMGRSVSEVLRRGKFLIFHFDDLRLVSHLGMSGRWLLRGDSNEEPEKHTHFRIRFPGSKSLDYVDPRRFGFIRLSSEKTFSLPLGPEPFEEKSQLALKLFERSKRSSRPIKSALLDQHFIAGLGNIYVCEVLHKCRIHPLTPVKLISLKRWEELAGGLCEILSRATEEGGTTIHTFSSNKIEGSFQDRLKVYGKNGLLCDRCQTIIKKLLISARSTYFCPRCQKLSKSE